VLTADEVVDQGLSRVAGMIDVPPLARGPMYRRVGDRQRELYAQAADENPERFGACATAQLIDGMADLNDITDPVPVPDRIQAVTIEDPGTSAYAAGDLVNIVRVDDQGAELPPRMLLRDGVLIGIQGDVDGVVSVQVHYPRLSDFFDLTDDTKEIELSPPYDRLLELDIAIWALDNDPNADPAAKQQKLAELRAEESGLVARWVSQVRNYGRHVSRFHWPRELRRDAE
jgi:hypothetical protein